MLACNAAQFSEGTCFTTYGAGGGGAGGGTHEISVFVNLTIDPAGHSISGYECYVNASGNHTLVRWNGAVSDFTPLASNNVSTFTAYAEGDVIRIERALDNQTLNCYQNGTLRTTFVDTTFLGGNPGLGNNPTNSGTVVINGAGWKHWHCGNM